MTGGKIDVYLDFASAFSYICFADLEANKHKLAAHGVTIEYHPVFLGDVNIATGDKLPWALPAEVAYLAYDTPRALRRVGLEHVQAPRDLLSFSMTVQPLRAIHYIKAHYPEAVFLATFHFLFVKFWTPPNSNISDEAVLRETLGQAVMEIVKGGKTIFTAAEVDQIMNGRAAFEDIVKKETDAALARGAFGLPWLWVTNAKGQEEPFFGSDCCELHGIQNCNKDPGYANCLGPHEVDDRTCYARPKIVDGNVEKLSQLKHQIAQKQGARDYTEAKQKRDKSPARSPPTPSPTSQIPAYEAGWLDMEMSASKTNAVVAAASTVAPFEQLLQNMIE